MSWMVIDPENLFTMFSLTLKDDVKSYFTVGQEASVASRKLMIFAKTGEVEMDWNDIILQIDVGQAKKTCQVSI